MRLPRARCHRGSTFLLIRMRDFLRMIGRLCGLGHNPWAAKTRIPAEERVNAPPARPMKVIAAFGARSVSAWR